LTIEDAHGNAGEGLSTELKKYTIFKRTLNTVDKLKKMLHSMLAIRGTADAHAMKVCACGGRASACERESKSERADSGAIPCSLHLCAQLAWQPLPSILTVNPTPQIRPHTIEADTEPGPYVRS
jgi:hypothetical protein